MRGRQPRKRLAASNSIKEGRSKMEPDSIVPQNGKSGKPTKAQVADLKETIVTGMSILRDKIRADIASSQAALKKGEEVDSALNVICERANDGDLEAFSELRSMAEESLRGVGSLDAVASQQRPARVKGANPRKRRIAPAPQEQASSIDLSRLHELRSMKEFCEKFLGNKLPSGMDCSDASEAAFRNASALLSCCADAEDGSAESGTEIEPTRPWVLDAIKLEVERLYVVNQRLLDLHDRAARTSRIQS